MSLRLEMSTAVRSESILVTLGTRGKKTVRISELSSIRHTYENRLLRTLEVPSSQSKPKWRYLYSPKPGVGSPGDFNCHKRFFKLH